MHADQKWTHICKYMCMYVHGLAIIYDICIGIDGGLVELYFLLYENWELIATEIPCGLDQIGGCRPFLLSLFNCLFKLIYLINLWLLLDDDYDDHHQTVLLYLAYHLKSKSDHKWIKGSMIEHKQASKQDGGWQLGGYLWREVSPTVVEALSRPTICPFLNYFDLAWLFSFCKPSVLYIYTCKYKLTHCYQSLI